MRNGWLLTDDLGRMDGDGYISFEGRKDDVIIPSGYRIGPGEIEFVDQLPTTPTGKIQRFELAERYEDRAET